MATDHFEYDTHAAQIFEVADIPVHVERGSHNDLSNSTNQASFEQEDHTLLDSDTTADVDDVPMPLKAVLVEKIKDMDMMLQRAMSELHEQSGAEISRLCRAAAAQYARLYPQSMIGMVLDL